LPFGGREIFARLHGGLRPSAAACPISVYRLTKLNTYAHVMRRMNTYEHEVDRRARPTRDGPPDSVADPRTLWSSATATMMFALVTPGALNCSSGGCVL
jgi:hypothetical protein